MAIGRLEGKVDGFMTAQIAQDRRLDDHDARIRGNEKNISRVAGALALATLLFGSIFSFLRVTVLGVGPPS
jgi:hypothetical protein